MFKPTYEMSAQAWSSTPEVLLRDASARGYFLSPVGCRGGSRHPDGFMVLWFGVSWFYSFMGLWFYGFIVLWLY